MDEGRAGALIRKHRRAAGLSQRQLADLANVSIGVIRDLEQHRTAHLQPRSVESLVRALGLDHGQAAALAGATGQGRTAEGTGVRLAILGSLAVWRGIQVDPGPPSQRAVLGVLALTPGVLVRREAIIDAIWGEDIPATAVNLVQKYVSRLRAVLDPARPPRDPGALLVSVNTSYRLQATTDQLDVLAFEQLAGDARAACYDGDRPRACELYERALGLWRGEPLADLDVLRDHPAVIGLCRRRADVIAEYAQAACAGGMYDRVLGHLRGLVAREPLNENAHALLMTALAGTGQQADALAVFEDLRIRLDEQLGVRPGPRLSSVHLQVLRQDVPANLATGRAWPAIPRQLAAPSRLFTGRADELNRLTAVLDECEQSAGVVIWAISGAGSIGKTSLALRWAHQNLDRFPDGQLWVNLRGFDPSGEPMSSELAVRGFLGALGVDSAAIPADPDAQAGLYRSLVAGKRMLVVLDNARDSSQVIPLLPASPGCTVLVTSRRQLTGLVISHGARLLDLDVLPMADARELLARYLGADRMAAEPDAVAELLACSAGLPLALSIVAARAAAHPGFPLAVLAAELREAATRLDALETGDLTASVRAMLSSSYRTLDPQAATVFGLTGLAPGPDISLTAAASLTMLPAPRARAVLRDLETASLVQQHVPGRYKMHDLLRLDAADQVSRDQPAGARTAALRRVTDFYLHTAFAADQRLSAHLRPIDLGEPASGCVPCPPADRAAALAWFDAEHACLLAALDVAAAEGWHTRVWQLAWTLDTFHELRGHAGDQLASWQAGFTAAEQAGQPAGRILALSRLGRACARAGLPAEALAQLNRAIALAEDAGDITSLADAHRWVCHTRAQQGEYHLALKHATLARSLFQALGHPVGEAQMLTAAGRCHAHLGRLGQARTSCEAALTLNRRHEDRLGEAAALDSLGFIALRAGLPAEAVAHYGMALALRRELGDRYHEAGTQAGLAEARAACGTTDTVRIQRRLDTLPSGAQFAQVRP
ncbi:MAG TPA: BTAD domain-containing putative transcriptional regulator [Streptosporangiaceae bacterium]|nr:BTAD domain-containing putative transcriptional regulator [Streptosporangiaceae bacterium]